MNRLKTIHFTDIFDILIFIIMIPISFLYASLLKLNGKKIWVISEADSEAGDNGFALFQYIRINYPEEHVYYAITKNSKDYQKVKQYGHCITFYSLKHWLYYMCADKILITHKHSSPSAKIFYVLQKLGWKKNKRIFLQHGITMNNVDYLHYHQTKYRLFICAAQKEYDYVLENFGYPKENVKLLGFSRFDSLYKSKIKKKQILIMPTWRKNIHNENDFLNSAYYKEFKSLLMDKNFNQYLKENHLEVLFFPHRNLSQYNDFFESNANIKVVSTKTHDIAEVLKESALLITDYSSVSLDFAYMNKPLIYYQFDLEEFREHHLQKGYFSYEKDGFGPVVQTKSSLINAIKNYCKKDMKQEQKYFIRTEEFFGNRSKNNSENIYKFIKEIKK